MLADLVQPDGAPWDACSRTFLKQAIAELATEGYAVHASFEPEFTLGRREPAPDGGPDQLVPVDDSLCYSSTGFAPGPRLRHGPAGRAAGRRAWRSRTTTRNSATGSRR